MNNQMIVKSAQSVFNRNGIDRETGNANAEKIAEFVSQNMNALTLKYGTDDIFDIAELVALEVVKTIKGMSNSL